MRELTSGGTYRLSIRVAGGPAEMTVHEGEHITEHQYRAVPDADRRRFRRVPAASPDTAADAADTTLQAS